MRRRSNIRFAAAVMLAGLAIGGCGGGGSGNNDGDRASPSSGPAARRSTTPSVPTPEAEVEAAYLAYWEMVQRLLETPDPNDPEIPRRVADPASGQLTDSLTTLETQGQVITTGAAYAHEVLAVEFTETAAIVTDCAIDDGAVIEVDSGRTVEERVVTVLLETTLRREGNVWVVTEIDQRELREGVTTCDQ